MTGTVERVVTNIKVDLVVNSKDELRRIVFGLEKETDDNGLPKWTIHFKLFQRKDASTAYTDPRISLDVVVDKELHGQAEATTKGLTARQSAYLAGPATAAAEAAQKPTGKPADEAIQRTLIKR